MRTHIVSVLIAMAAASSVYAQSIPPYGGGQTQLPDSIPNVQEKKKDLPAKAGSYIVEAGANFYYTKGDYYTPKDQFGADATDSKGAKYTPWGFQLNPSAEFFLFDMVALGGTAGFSYDKFGADNSITLGVGPLLSFYYHNSYPFIPFVSVFALYQHTNEYHADTKSQYWVDQGTSYGGKLGFVYMVSRQGGVFLDGRFTYGSHKVTFPPATTQENAKGWIAESYFGYKFFIF